MLRANDQNIGAVQGDVTPLHQRLQLQQCEKG
jgi:hypothetical protein